MINTYKNNSSDSFLFEGENREVMASLLNNEAIKGKIKLVYIDPPYSSNQIFTVSSGRSVSVGRVADGEVAYKDTMSRSEYLAFMKERLTLIHSLLAEDGCIYVHVDLKIGHYIKIILDDIFGIENYINDITRIKCNPKNFSRKAFGNYKDVIYFYSKSNNYTFNDVRENLSSDTVDKRYTKTSPEGRKYTTVALHAPGVTLNGATGGMWKGLMPPPGRHWRVAMSVLDEWDAKGLVEWSKTGNPRQIVYADEAIVKGDKLQDVWDYKDPPNPRYPTEKNNKMLEMIIKTSSNEGDLVADFFCGSGSTLMAANKLNRNWIGVDESPIAVSVCKRDLNLI